MRHGSLFSGIGGFDLAAEWMGWENVFHCEWNEFGQRHLKYYWPRAKSYGDITKTDFTIHRGSIDVLSGGFPCQPYSLAGKRLGKEDERHLWPEMLRAIREIQPRWVVGENVFGLVNWNGGLVFDEVQADLEAQGYEVQPYVLPACAVNAPHRRDRVWFVAKNTNKDGWRSKQRESQPVERQQRDISAGDNERLRTNDAEVGITSNASRICIQGQLNGQREGQFGRGDWRRFPTQSPIRQRNDGLPYQLDGITFSKWRNESIKAYGNAVVPQVVFQIFKAIEQYERQTSTRPIATP